ncbi:MAG: response regulator [Candidatus Eisenbacteria bacterium]|nr:response regulator [Candidatus Eisenbacteria bacterium]
MNKPNILIVDDEQAITASLSYCLEKEGFDVQVADSGEQAVRTVLDRVPDLIISDVMMPGMDGYEFCRRIREYHKTENIPFLFLTARDGHESQVRGKSFGCTEYITKPFDLNELVRRVRAILASRTASPETNR